MPSGGTLTVETRVNQEGICIVVGDTGSGISDELTDQIFLPFFTTKDINEGTGLGLAVVYGIVQRHQGRIWLESHKEKGTTFFIELPFKHQDKDKND